MLAELERIAPISAKYQFILRSGVVGDGGPPTV
jgi:hypothetical protein